MRIALPITNGKVSLHFGHCQQFAVVDVDTENKQITGTEMMTPPLHQPGVLPTWLNEINVNMVIAGGMGRRAQQLFTQNNIRVLVGAPGGTPESVVGDYLQDKLECGDNICDH